MLHKYRPNLRLEEVDAIVGGQYEGEGQEKMKKSKFVHAGFQESIKININILDFEPIFCDEIFDFMEETCSYRDRNKTLTLGEHQHTIDNANALG